MDIKKVIKAKGLTVKTVADRMGIAREGLSNHINGNPSVQVLERIAAAIGCQVGDFFERRSDFVAFVRDQGKIYTFDTIKALKEYADAAHKAAENMRQFGDAVEMAKSKEE